MMVSRRLALGLLLGLVLISKSAPSGKAAEPAPASIAEPITFCKHIAPILWENCTSCHRPGEVGPFSLLTYQDTTSVASPMSNWR
jgi:hypothetical protein